MNRRSALKVCVTHYAFYPTTGGVESHLIDLCAELVRQGHEVHALVGSLDGSPSEEVKEGIQIHRRDELNIELVRERKLAAGREPDIAWLSLRRELRGSSGTSSTPMASTWSTPTTSTTSYRSTGLR